MFINGASDFYEGYLLSTLFFKIMYNRRKERRDEKGICILLKLSYKLIAEY